MAHTTIVFVADLHISRYPPKNALVAARLAALEAQYPGAFLVVAGDVVDDGHPDQYREAERLLSPWRGRLLLACGNHDCGPLGLTWSPASVACWLGLQQRLGAQVEAIIPSDDGWAWRVCCLDSVNATPGPWDLARGSLGGAEIERARLAIDRGHRSGQRVCLVLHHDPNNHDLGMGLEDAKPFLAAVKQADLVVCGHSHRHSVSRVPGHCDVVGLDWMRADKLDCLVF
jgi:predicted phosphodiesterase